MSKRRKYSMIISLCLVFSAFFSLRLFAAEDNGQESLATISYYPEIPSVYNIEGLEKGISQESDNEEGLNDLEEPEQEANLVFDYFGYSKSYLLELVEAGSVKFSLPLLGFGDDQDFRKAELNKLGDLSLSSGFNKERITTFSNVKYLEGQAPVGTAVGVIVFHFEDQETDDLLSEDHLLVTQEDLTAVGASEIYTETIELDYIGVNYVLIATYNPESEESAYNLFRVNREQEDKRLQLENVQIDFFDEEDEDISIENLVPGLVDYDF